MDTVEERHSMEGRASMEGRISARGRDSGEVGYYGKEGFPGREGIPRRERYSNGGKNSMEERTSIEDGYWKKFENSGRIEDYLSFVSSARAREGEHAGTYMCNGYYTETEPGGRVRQAYQPFD